MSLTSINWYDVISTILWIVFGFLVTYFRQKAAVIDHAKFAINAAEKQYESATKAGGLKFEYACDMVYSFVPSPLKPFITRQFVGETIQKAFDGMQAYANKQLDKVVDKVVK